MIPPSRSHVRLVQSVLIAPFFAFAAVAESSFVGNWTFDDGRTVAIHDDRTVEVFHSGTGAREDVGEWKEAAGGGCIVSWKNGDRHVVKVGEDGDTLRGTFHGRGRLDSQPASAARAQPAEEDGTSYFGSASPTGDAGPAESVEVVEEESDPRELGEDSYAEKVSADPVEEAPIERTETQTVLLPADARLSGGVLIEHSSGTIANWKGEGDAAAWSVAHLKPGKYNVAIEHSVGMGRSGGRFEVSTGSGKMSALARTTGGWKTFKRKPIGSLEIADGDMELRFTATDVVPGASLMNVRSVELRRQ